MKKAMARSATEPLILLAVTSAALVVSGLDPHNWTIWMLEVAPIFIVAPLMLWTWRRFPLTPLMYRLALLHALVLILGAHYTYARMPAGFWLQDWLELSRNHYDRLGHVMQGFVPAIAAREILLRCSPLRRGAWLILCVTSICLAFSALYELIEWWAALLGGEDADAFLGTQGDPWDTQWDMFLALCGAMSAQIVLAGAHDRQIALIEKR